MAKKNKEPAALVAQSVSRQALTATTDRSTLRGALELERLRHQTYAQIIDQVFWWLRTTVRAGAWCFVAFCLYRSIHALAGQKTFVHTAINTVLQVGASQWAAYIVAILCGIGYTYERRLRLRANQEQGTYIQRLETAIDPKRSTSRLTTRGIPTKEDRDAI